MKRRLVFIAVCCLLARTAVGEPLPTLVLDRRFARGFGHAPIWAVKLDGRFFNEDHGQGGHALHPVAAPAGGQSRCAPSSSFRQSAREAVELTERCNVAATIVVVENANALGVGPDNEYSAKIEGTSVAEREAALRAAVKLKHDAIILGLVKWTVLPQDARNAILEQVKSGAGLVIVHPLRDKDNDLKELTQTATTDNQRAIASLFPFDALGAFAKQADPEKLVETYRLGAGRVAILNYAPQGDGYYTGLALTPTIDL